MPFHKPMLSSPLKPGFTLEQDRWAAEEKIDGIRIVCEVSSGSTNLFTTKRITPWSRYEKIHPLPTHIMEEMCKLPDGVYDGEVYVPGKRSYGATEIINQPNLIYCIFDLVQFEGTDTTPFTYDSRRQLLTEVLKSSNDAIQLLESTEVNTFDEVIALRDAVWARDGEGLILKRRAAPYQIGKRSKDFIKIKALKSAVLTIIGFVPSKGLINDRGPFATVLLQDEDGNVTAVKTRNDAECRKFEQEAGVGIHPAIGRKLQIEYQERTPDGSYRHPRWDHFVE